MCKAYSLMYYVMLCYVMLCHGLLSYPKRLLVSVTPWGADTMLRDPPLKPLPSYGLRFRQAGSSGLVVYS
jgi:hypothetical protein